MGNTEAILRLLTGAVRGAENKDSIRRLCEIATELLAAPPKRRSLDYHDIRGGNPENTGQFSEARGGESLTKPQNRGIITVKHTETTAAPNSVTQEITRHGGINRNFYGDDGRQTKQITNNNHGHPKSHPYGTHGEHAHDYEWDNGSKIPRRNTRELTDEERREAGDML
jgi:hypothetical protein